MMTSSHYFTSSIVNSGETLITQLFYLLSLYNLSLGFIGNCNIMKQGKKERKKKLISRKKRYLVQMSLTPGEVYVCHELHSWQMGWCLTISWTTAQAQHQLTHHGMSGEEIYFSSSTAFTHTHTHTNCRSDTYRTHYLVERSLHKAKLAFVQAVCSCLIICLSLHDVLQFFWWNDIFFVYTALKNLWLRIKRYYTLYTNTYIIWWF